MEEMPKVIRSASNTFTSADVEACDSSRQLKLYRFTVEKDIIILKSQIEGKSLFSKQAPENLEARTKYCLCMQELLLTMIDERLFVLGGE